MKNKSHTKRGPGRYRPTTLLRRGRKLYHAVHRGHQRPDR